MSDQERDPREERLFDEFLKKTLTAAGSGRGSCPETQVLASYLSGELSQNESNRLSSHLEACGVCEALIEGMRRFDEAAASGKNLPSSADWSAAETSLEGRFQRFLESQGGQAGQSAGGRHGSARSLFVSFIRSPLPAYILVLILAYPAYLGVSMRWGTPRESAPPRTETAPLPPPVLLESARILQLDATRRGKPVLPESDERVIILSFFVPIRPGREYSAEIKDSSGKTVTTRPKIRSSDDKGNFYVVWDRQHLRGVEYLLIVMETDPVTGVSTPRARFSFFP